MSTFSVSYGSLSSDISGSALNSLGNGSVGISTAVDNITGGLYQDYVIEVYIDGTAASTAFLEVRALCSLNGTDFGLWESGIPLGVMDFSVDLQRAYFSLVGHGGLYQAPPYFKIAVRNLTGATLAASGSTIKYMGVQITVA